MYVTFDENFSFATCLKDLCSLMHFLHGTDGISTRRQKVIEGGAETAQ
jgi:hypothetical protein